MSETHPSELPPQGGVDPIVAAEPFVILRRWLEQARAAGVPSSTTLVLSTVSADGQPTARVVDLKLLEPDALVFTSALWTRKARDIAGNPQVAGLFHWPLLGRQVHVVGEARQAERELSEELFAAREPAHRLQTLVSRQGEVIDDLEPLRARLRELSDGADTPSCPDDWGAFRLSPAAIEFWQLSPDRLHDRWLFERCDDAWRRKRLAP